MNDLKVGDTVIIGPPEGFHVYPRWNCKEYMGIVVAISEGYMSCKLYRIDTNEEFGSWFYKVSEAIAVIARKKNLGGTK